MLVDGEVAGLWRPSKKGRRLLLRSSEAASQAPYAHTGRARARDGRLAPCRRRRVRRTPARLTALAGRRVSISCVRVRRVAWHRRPAACPARSPQGHGPAHLLGRAARIRFAQRVCRGRQRRRRAGAGDGLELTELLWAAPRARLHVSEGRARRRPDRLRLQREGQNQLTRTGDLILYAGLQAPVWKDDSHVAYLRHPDGKIIDTMHAGRPPRHPDGH